MALTNAQFDRISREYADTRLRHQYELESRTKELYRRYPRLKELHDLSVINAASRARAGIRANCALMEKLEKERASYKAEEAAIFSEAHLSPDVLMLSYDCPDCRDTGFVGSKKCVCRIQKEIDLLYANSGLRELSGTNCFDKFDYTLFSDEAKDGRKSDLEAAKLHVETCKNYVRDFDLQKGHLLFYGPPGTGKTFLSCAVANELLKDGHSVFYFSAMSLFELFEKTRFKSFDDNEEDAAFEDYLLRSDLLIIDDLGTESGNAYANSRFFNLVNERLIRRKSMIISTNLSPKQLSDAYSERFASRVLTEFTPVPLLGEDLRLKLKFRNLS